MLSEKEIDEYYDTLKEYFLDQNNYKIKLGENWLKTNSLISDKSRLVCIAKEPMTIRSLSDEICKPLYSFYTKDNANYEIWVEKKKCWKWIKNQNTNQWEQNFNILSTSELYYYILVNQKSALLDKIHHQIDFYRNRYTKVSPDQNTVYILKYLEAKEIIEKNITIDEFLNYPFTKGYSTHKDIPLQQAAKEILLNFEMQNGFLAESENLRMKYTDIIRKEKDIKNLNTIYNDFVMENHISGSL